MMADISMASFTDAELNAFANQIFIATMDGLVYWGEMDHDDAERIKSSYAFLCAQKGMFGKFFDTLRGLDSGGKMSLQLALLENGDIK
jgi:hypothetical protein